MVVDVERFGDPARTNLDQLAVRAGLYEALEQAFSVNVAMFERGWYGLHPVDAGQVGEFVETFMRMKAYAEV